MDAYKSVIDVWKTYKRVNTLGIVTSDRRIIKEIFDFHKTINDHVILYFSSKKVPRRRMVGFEKNTEGSISIPKVSPIISENALSERALEVVRDARDAALTPTFVDADVALGGRIAIGGFPNPGGLLGQVNVAVDRSTGASSSMRMIFGSA